MLGVLRMAPWRRGPYLLLQRPGVVTALVAASFVAALPAAAAAPFVSSARNATLAHRIADSCLYRVGPTATTSILPTTDMTGVVFHGNTASGGEFALFDPAQIDRVVTNLKRQVNTQPGFGPPDVQVMPAKPLVTNIPDPTPETPAKVTLLVRPGFQQHVTVVDGPRGQGVWVPDGWARETHVKVGSTIGVPFRDPFPGSSASAVVKLRVAAVYRDLRSVPDQPYWCADKEIYSGPPGSDFSNVAVPPLVLTDKATVTRTLFQQMATFEPFGFNSPLADIVVSFPLADPNLSVESARSLVRRIDGVTDPTPSKAETYPEVYKNSTSELGLFVARAEFTGRATVPGIAPITIAGVLIGLLMVAAAAVFWVLRRSRELTVLSARGIGAGALGVKAVIESLPALAAGAVAGWAAAIALVREAGPVRLLSGGSPRTAAYLAAASLVVSVLVVGVTAAVRCRSLADERRRRDRRHVLSWPWELLLLAGAPVAWHFMSGATTIQSDTAGAVVHVPARLLVVPLMVVIGAAAFVGRIVALWLRRRTRRASPRSSALYIGLQRIAREAAIVVLLAGATAAPIALAAYGGTVTRSVKASVDAEAQLHVGSDVVVDVPAGTGIPASLAGHATLVGRINGLVVSGVQTDILGVDPGTFAQGAYWDAQINGETMTRVLAPLRVPGAAGRPYPAIGSAGLPSGDQTISYLNLPRTTFDVHAVTVLPGVQGGYPLMIVPATSLVPANPAVVNHQIWIRGDPVKIRAELARANLPVTHISSSDDLFVDTLYDPLTFTFQYLTALSLLSGLVTMVGLLLYLEARTPRHRRSYVMFRRMGLRPRTHRAALLIELGIPLTGGLVGGLVLAAGLAKALSANFDVDVTVPPGTILSAPVQVVLAIAAGVLVLAAAAAMYAQLRIGRARPSEVLRDTI